MIIAFLALLGMFMCIFSGRPSRWLSGAFVLVLFAQGLLVLYTFYFGGSDPVGPQLLGMLLLMLMPVFLALVAAMSEHLHERYCG